MTILTDQEYEQLQVGDKWNDNGYVIVRKTATCLHVAPLNLNTGKPRKTGVMIYSKRFQDFSPQ